MDKLFLARVLIKLDVQTCIRAIRYDRHLHTIWTEVCQAICQIGNKVFLLDEIVILNASRFVH